MDVMLILASASPRRHELLLAAGIDHVIHPTHIPEQRLTQETPVDFVRRLAKQKAQAAFRPNQTILAADTEVCIDGEVLGKPKDDPDAARMLQLLSGRDHWVHTGICILSDERRIVDVASTRVSFVHLTEDEIQEYTRSGEPRDKAGAYAIQGRASRYVRSIMGCYHNVVGLPVSLVYSHLKSI